MNRPRLKPRIQPDAKGQVNFYVTSGYGSNTHEPFVEVDVNGHITQMSPAQARAIGLNLMEAAEAAESDEFIVTFAKEIGMDERGGAKLLNAFRHLRNKRRGESPEAA